jgi:glycolate dehydrogenase FAD-linked subunit
VPDAALAELAALVAGTLRTDPDITASYSRDEADLVPSVPPIATLAAGSADDVVAALGWASEHRIPVVPRGAGTGLSGGVATPMGALVLDLTAMNRILEIDAADRVARVEAGVVNSAVSAAAAPHGLMYAPDPSSWETSTIGGNLATNAGGLRCIRYGATRASVLGLTAVLADGRVLRTGGRTAKRSAGYDLTQLLVGSEGTLGVIVEATLRLHPLPPPLITGLLTFASTVDAAATAAALVRDGPRPLLAELIDAGHVVALDAARGTGFGSQVHAVLIVQVDDVPGAGDAVEKVATAHGATDVALTTDPAESTALIDIRRAAYPSMQQYGRTLVEDVCVPCSSLATLIDRIETIAASSEVQIACVAHAGDGNVHPVLVVPDAPDGEDRVWTAADRIFTAAIDLGGTVSGEHGIGRLKRRWLADEVGEVSIDVQRSIKAALDPLGILNPGAIFDLPA